MEFEIGGNSFNLETNIYIFILIRVFTLNVNQKLLVSLISSINSFYMEFLKILKTCKNLEIL